MMRGNSFSNGQSTAMGASVNNGPGAQEWMQGWPPLSASVWDHLDPKYIGGYA